MSNEERRKYCKGMSSKWCVEIESSAMNLHEKLISVCSTLCTIATNANLEPERFQRILELTIEVYKEKFSLDKKENL